MKRLKFEKLWLMSLQERRARSEEFDDDLTCVVADNDFGKSSLIKSLYASFGADPTRTPPAWKAAKIVLLLRFNVDGEVYYMLRQEGFFALFDAEKALLWVASSVTSGVAPRISELLNFEIQLKQRGGESRIPTPAFCFLPFYIDQDKGWSDTWSSFDGLGMFPGYYNDIADFHTGIKPREYYLAKVDKDAATVVRNELSSEKGALLKAKSRFTAKRRVLGIGLDVESFKGRIEALLKEQNALQSAYDRIREAVGITQSHRASAQEEAEIAVRVLKELKADIKFSSDILENEVVCPVCSTVHENDFANRFGLVNDADACRTILVAAQARVELLDAEIAEKLGTVRNLDSKIQSIRGILNETRGKVKLADMLKDESERLVDKSFDEEETVLNSAIGSQNTVILDAEARMRELLKKPIKDKIVKFYAEKLRAFCGELGIGLPEDAITTKVRPVISETGSVKPRLMLAYYYAILHTINEFSSACFCPIVVDTPLQQDPDPENARRMVKFAVTQKPADSQLVLATGSLHGVEVNGTLIEPAEKNALLSESQFDEVYSEVMPFVNASLA
jgi:hypothetical protein